MRPLGFILAFFILSSVFAGYLYITQERFGTGTRFILNWAQGESSYSTGPAQCWADRPKGDATYITPGSDDSGPYSPDVVQNCQECDCNLGSSIEDYDCKSDLQCKLCPTCPGGCGVYEKCDTSQGRCNSFCTCDPVKCTGTYCRGDDVYERGCSGGECVGVFVRSCSGCVNQPDGSSLEYTGCSGGSCTIVSYPCPNCRDKVTTCVYYVCDRNGENCRETGRDVGASCPSDCGYESGGQTYTCKEIQTCP